MKKYFFFIISFCLPATIGFSQTKRIAFESHSGTMNIFSISLSNDLFDNKESDFGGPGLLIKSNLDSVILTADSTLILFTTTYDYGPGFHIEENAKPNEIRRTKDTVAYNPIFKGKHFISSVSAVIGRYYRWGDVTDSTKFIGFGQKTEEIKKESKPKELSSPLFKNDTTNNNSPFGPQLIIMIGSVLLLSLTGGFISWKLYKPHPATV